MLDVKINGQLTLEEIAETNDQRCRHWHKEGDWTDERWFTATAGEFGELGLAALKFMFLGNQVKKEFRAKEGSPGILKGETLESLSQEIEDEWADVMLYLILFASHRNIRMSAAIRRVFNRKSEQLGLEERL